MASPSLIEPFPLWKNFDKKFFGLDNLTEDM